MSGLLDALQYGLGALQKPGRAVRGILAGRPDEALAALPFSDTLGLTDESRAVSGTDLLDQLGLNPGGTAGDVAGFAADALTDPLTYAGGRLAAGALKLARRTPGPAGTLDEAVARLAPAEFDLDSPFARALDRTAPPAPPRTVPASFEPTEPPLPPQIPRARGLQSPAPQSTEDIIAAMEAERLATADRHAAELASLRPLEQMRHPSDYGLMDPFNPPPGIGEVKTTSLPGHDLLQENNPLQAMMATYGAWKQALADVNRLSPQARAAFADDRSWQALLANRTGEINAAQRAQDFLAPEAKALLPHLADQDNFIAWSAPSQSSHFSRQSPEIEDLYKRVVTALDYGPQEAGHVLPHLGSLPVDERALKAAMAREHLDLMNRRTQDILADVFDEPYADLVGRPAPTLDTLAVFDPEFVGQRIGHVLDPHHLSRSKVPPRLVNDFYSRIDDTTAGLLRRTLEHLADTGHAPPYVPPALAERIARLGG